MKIETIDQLCDVYESTKDKLIAEASNPASIGVAEIQNALRDMRDLAVEEIKRNTYPDHTDIIALEKVRFNWSLETFPEATPQGSLAKAKEELQEILAEISKGRRDPEEYADAIMCIFDIAGRMGINASVVMLYYANKIQKNKQRTWIKNPDNSYSHIKDNS
ncbi:dATP/dGTP pyrophosphohydrolase domain-containing protein [Sediminibacter sp. Hel_I_10]|uniref:dATP/dGTP pyrophosphohydrolase domain-containing protein n=1 Tax=Sediminibacter sp. Hel_I_10 TaxID=1392490 RepID=UPI00047A0EBD|nr:dATP/dGTP pyrophosphohydrolase domain-containing protein [Sediminibacter sp. Hel_I_10]